MSKDAWFSAYESGLNGGMGQGVAAQTAAERISQGDTGLGHFACRERLAEQRERIIAAGGYPAAVEEAGQPLSLGAYKACLKHSEYRKALIALIGLLCHAPRNPQTLAALDLLHGIEEEVGL